MRKQTGFSETTGRYLEAYRAILDTMVEDMTNVELSDSISYNFIVQMIPHHRAAIEMSENVLEYITDDSLQEIASRIITEQTQSINDMERIESFCSELVDSRSDLIRYQRAVNQILRVMFYNMRHAYTTDRIECDFMREMIPHHMGAVEMGTNALRFPICTELQPVIESIIVSQKRGIAQMEALLKQLRC